MQGVYSDHCMTKTRTVTDFVLLSYTYCTGNHVVLEVSCSLVGTWYHRHWDHLLFCFGFFSLFPRIPFFRADASTTSRYSASRLTNTTIL